MRAFIRVPGVLALVALAACTDADGDGVRAGLDCDDDRAEAWPGNVEVCDGIDNDCDGQIDEDVAIDAWQDRDGDGFGDPDRKRRVCALPADGVENGDDCDDRDPTTFPGAPEVCDARDNDCNQAVDDGVGQTYYRDADGDGHGVPGDTVEACFVPEGYARLDDDCDDAEPEAWTDRPEICDGVDNDCDREIDEDAPLGTWWADADGDGYGDPDVYVGACGPGAGAADNPLDCDDGDPTLNPDTPEISGNGVDDDCDGWIDETEVPGLVPDLDDALAAASPGDVIQLGEGVWTGPFDLSGRDVVLAGEGCSRTVLYGDGLGTTVFTDGGGLHDLAIRAGTDSGLKIEGDVDASGLCLEENEAPERGGAIEILEGTLTIADSRLHDNLSYVVGGAVYVSPDGVFDGTRVDVRGNVAANAGGAFDVRSGVLRLESSVIAGNRVGVDASGIHAVHRAGDGTPGDPPAPTGATVDLRFVTVDGGEIYGSFATDGVAIHASGASLDTRPVEDDPYTTRLTLDHVLIAHHEAPDEELVYDAATTIVDYDHLGLWKGTTRTLRTDHVLDAVRGAPDYVFRDPNLPADRWDLRLLSGSAFLDAGDPGVLDADGTRADIGGYGGPAAADGASDGLDADQDADGLPDPWELAWGLHPWRDDSGEDPDGDGLDHAGEFAAGTSPTVADTDGDGVDDGDEVSEGSDPRNPEDQRPVVLVDVWEAVAVGDAVDLDATWSFDPQGQPLTLSWAVAQRPGGSTATLSSASGTTSSLTPDAAGTWVIEVTADDGRSTTVHPVTLEAYTGARVSDAASLALEVALAGAGDAILLEPGVYDTLIRPIGVDGLTLVGLGDPGEVVIAPTTSGSVVDVARGDAVTLRQLTLEGATGADEGGGLRCRECSTDSSDPQFVVGCLGRRATVDLHDVVVDGNRAGDGGGIWMSACDGTWTDVTVTGNTATSGDGGGVHLDRAGVVARRLTIAGNTALGDGGGLFVDNENVQLDLWNAWIQGNDAAQGTAIWYEGTTGAAKMGLMRHLTIADHHDAGADVVFFQGGRVLFQHALFFFNDGVHLVGVGRSSTVPFVLQPVFYDWGGDPFERDQDEPDPIGIGDPRPLLWVDDGLADDALTPRPGGSIVDAGQPDRFDADGTIADVGHGGGAHADPWLRLDHHDRDGDGMPDGWERRYGLDAFTDDAAGDLDGDGATNGAEWAAGTHPGR